jgi:hypothetical protein
MIPDPFILTGKTGLNKKTSKSACMFYYCSISKNFIQIIKLSLQVNNLKADY